MKPSVRRGMSLGQDANRPYRLAPQRGPTTASALPRLTYSVAEVAEMLGRSRSFTYDLIKEGQLRAVIQRGDWVVLRDDLDQYLRGMEEV